MVHGLLSFIRIFEDIECLSDLFFSYKTAFFCQFTIGFSNIYVPYLLSNLSSEKCTITKLRIYLHLIVKLFLLHNISENKFLNILLDYNFLKSSTLIENIDVYQFFFHYLASLLKVQSLKIKKSF